MNYTDFNKLNDLTPDIALTITLDIYPRYNNKVSQNKLKIKNIVAASKKSLLELHLEREIKDLLANLDSEVAKIDLQKSAYGLIIYVSNDFSTHYYLPFNPGSDFKIADHFKTRNIIRAIEHGENYYLMTLSQGEMRLFKGYLNKIYEEVTDFGFPFLDNRNIETDALKRSFASRNDLLNQEFYRNAQEAFEEIYKENPAPVIIAAPEEAYANYITIEKDTQFIVGHIRGNYDNPNNTEKDILANQAYELIKGYQSYMQAHSIEKIEEADAQHLVEYDVFTIHDFALNGQVKELYIQEDYYVPATLSEDNRLISASSEGKNIADAVNLVIKEVLNQGGSITFIDQYLLDNQKEIAAILRWR